MRYLLIVFLFIVFHGFSQVEIPVKYDSIVKLRYNNYVIFKKKKVGVYNAAEDEFTAPMTKGTGFVFHDFNRWDVLVLKGKKYYQTFLFSQDSTQQLPNENKYRRLCISYSAGADTIALDNWYFPWVDDYNYKILVYPSYDGESVFVSHTDENDIGVHGLYNHDLNSWVFPVDSLPVYNVLFSYLRENEECYDIYYKEDKENKLGKITSKDSIEKQVKMVCYLPFDSHSYDMNYNFLKIYNGAKTEFRNFQLFNEFDRPEFIYDRLFWNDQREIIPIANNLILAYDEQCDKAFTLYEYDLIHGDSYPDSLVSFNSLKIDKSSMYGIPDPDIEVGVLDGYYNGNSYSIYVDEKRARSIDLNNLLVSVPIVFEIELLDSNLITVTQYSGAWHDENKSGYMTIVEFTTNSGLYIIDQQKWIKPEGCSRIVPLSSGGFIFNCYGNERYYTLDKNGDHAMQLNLSDKYLSPLLILGAEWDSISPINYRETRDEEVQYYQAFVDGKQCIYDKNDFTDFAPHETITKPVDFAYYHRSTGYSITINEDTLEVFLEGHTQFKEAIKYDTTYFYMGKFNHDTGPIFHQYSQKIVEDEDLHIQMDIYPDEIVINSPEFIVDEGYFGEYGDFAQFGYSQNHSSVYKKSNGLWSQSLPYFASIEKFAFGYIAHTGSYYVEGDYTEEMDYSGELPLFNQGNNYLLFNNDFNSMIHFDFVEFDNFIDLGFGLQIFINELSFFMTYTGKVLTECSYDEFIIEDNKLVGIKYDKSVELMNDDYEIYYLPLKRDTFELE